MKGIEGLKFEVLCDADKGFATTNDQLVTGVRWLPGNRPRQVTSGMPLWVRVLLHGDHLRDEKGRGLDGNNLPKWVPKRKSGDGIEGGTFMSWFRLVAD